MSNEYGFQKNPKEGIIFQEGDFKEAGSMGESFPDFAGFLDYCRFLWEVLRFVQIRGDIFIGRVRSKKSLNHTFPVLPILITFTHVDREKKIKRTS